MMQIFQIQQKIIKKNKKTIRQKKKKLHQKISLKNNNDIDEIEKLSEELEKLKKKN